MKPPLSMKVNYKDANALSSLTSYFIHHIPFHVKQLVVCSIGTDRCLGDAIGPLVGTNLTQSSFFDVPIFGTLQQPVHATNCHEMIEKIERLYPSAYIIAIDACLGHASQIGKIIVEQSPIYPGLALQKEIKPVGNMSIKAIVNKISSNPLQQLQSTRLHFIMELSELIANALIQAYITIPSKPLHYPNHYSYHNNTRQ